MSEKSIKIKIGNRSYPLNIEPDDEGKVQEAADLINQNIHNLKNDYSVKDPLDLVSMTALEYTTRFIEEREGKENDMSDNSDILATIKELSKKLDDQLEKI